MPVLSGMPKDVDERKKRKALRKIRKAAQLAEQGLGPPLSDWEKQFLDEVEERIETYGSAFHDPDKGAADEALSALQHAKLREIGKKARGKGKTGFQAKSGFKRKSNPRVRQIDEDVPAPEPAPKRSKPALVKASELPAPPNQAPAPKRPAGKPSFRVIQGGADAD